MVLSQASGDAVYKSSLPCQLADTVDTKSIELESLCVALYHLNFRRTRCTGDKYACIFGCSYTSIIKSFMVGHSSALG